jgi:hypothetical protein
MRVVAVESGQRPDALAGWCGNVCAMGQMVSVMRKPSSLPGVVRFETNRSLTGQGHETFHAVADAVGPRPAAELARRLLETGRVDSVHVYSNQVTVLLARGFDAEALDGVVESLYQYWKPGMEPTVFEAPEAEASAADAGAGGESTGAGSEYERRVPAVLIERSRAAMARWKAKQDG